MTRATGQPAPQPWSLTDRELAMRLSWFISIRWFAGLVAVLFLLVSWHVFHIRFSGVGYVVERIVAAVFALFFYNAVLALLVKGFRSRGTLSLRVIHIIANVQIVCDLICVAFLWHSTGGMENAFGILFIFPMVWAGELLSRRNAYLYAFLGTVLINAVLWGEYIHLIPHVHIVREAAGGTADVFIRPTVYMDWHRVFMLSVAISGALFVTVFLAATVAARLRHRENQLDEAYRKLKSVDILKSQFMRKASHELRAPLSATHMMLKTVLMGITGKVDAKQEEMIARAAERTDSLMDLINDLLRYSRLEAEAALHADYQPVSLADVTRRTVELLAPSAEAGNVRLASDIRPARVLADEEGLTELVTNLLSNAIRYTPDGGDVAVAVSRDAGRAVLVVTDSGIGISGEDLSHIFDEFFRSSAAKEAVQHGTGMGLAISKKLVESFHGTIDVRSEPGHGSTFTVRLPILPQQ